MGERKSEAQLVIDALQEAGALTDEQHQAASEALERLIVEQWATRADGTAAGV